MSKGFSGEVILRQKVDRLGDEGEIVRVKPGYARNYLIPRGLAVMATPGNIRMMEAQKELGMLRQKQAVKQARQMAEKLSRVELTASVQVGEEDRVFGSVTAMTLSKLLKEQGYSVDKNDVLLDEPIKSLGVYTVRVRLQPDVETEVKVYVIKE
ncbi:MAG: 50S ribosomal protein L9 [Fidelibacterota bacterium]